MGRSRVKSEHAPYRISVNRIRIGGVAAEISGRVRMDAPAAHGRYARVGEIVRGTISAHPDVVADTVRMTARGVPNSATNFELEVRGTPGKGHGVRLNSFTELARLFERVQKRSRIFIALAVKSQLIAWDHVFGSYTSVAGTCGSRAAHRVTHSLRNLIAN